MLGHVPPIRIHPADRPRRPRPQVAHPRRRQPRGAVARGGNGRVVATEARREVPPVGYDPSQFPAFAVTVDVVILTMSAGKLHMLLVSVARRRSRACGRSQAGSSVPPRRWTRRDESLSRKRCRRAEPATQFGAYGDPERDPRMNVVTVGYLPRCFATWERSWPARMPQWLALVPVSDVLNGRIEPAFDHLQIVARNRARSRRARGHGHRDRVRGNDVTLAELRAVYEAVWGAARRSELPAQHRRGGRLGDPHRAPSATKTPVRRTARRAVSRWTGMEPRRSDPSIPARREEVTYESRRSRHVRTTRSPSPRGGRHSGTEGRRGPRQGLRHLGDSN